jgi:Tn3 transposase DDE domain
MTHLLFWFQPRSHIKRIGDWHLTEEAQRGALTELVSAIADLDISSRWGAKAGTAASDEQRFSDVKARSSFVFDSLL